MAPGPTPALAAYSSLLPTASRHQDKHDLCLEGLVSGQQDEYELCPEGLLLGKEIARRVVRKGGASLITDYGSEEVAAHTLRVRLNL